MVSEPYALRLQCGECPGVNAFYCEGRGWVLSADEMNKMEFRGQYANIRCWDLGNMCFCPCHTFSPGLD